ARSPPARCRPRRSPREAAAKTRGPFFEWLASRRRSESYRALSPNNTGAALARLFSRRFSATSSGKRVITQAAYLTGTLTCSAGRGLAGATGDGDGDVARGDERAVVGGRAEHVNASGGETSGCRRAAAGDGERT